MRSADYYVKKRLKVPKSFFEWGNSQFPKIIFSNKNTTITSNRDGCKIINKKLTKKTKLTFWECYKCFAIILCTSKRIEIQSYVFESRYIEGIQHLSCYLINYELFENDKNIQCGRNYFYPDRFQFGLRRQSSMSGPYTNVMFYDNGFEKTIKDKSELKYINWDSPIDVWNIRRFYKYRKEIEFLQKINAKQLVKEVMYRSDQCDMRIINEKWLRGHKHKIKNSDICFEKIILEERIRERNGKIVPGIEQYLTHVNFDKIPKCVGIIHFQNWAIKNRIDFRYYIDYLRLMEQCNVPINDTNACPRNLSQAHDHLVDLYNALERERKEQDKRNRDRELKNKFDELVKARQYMEMEINGLKFVLPKKASDIVNEGSALHHCVSTYVDRHASGTITIVFIRNAEAPKKPLYTMEFCKKEIVQIRAKYNQNPPKEVWSAAEIWKKKVLNGRRKVTNG
nr:MAG TPA: PcfJ like protein [Caudoviricetes sp.]